MTHEYVNHLQSDNISVSLKFVGISVPPRIFQRGLHETPMSWLELGLQILPHLWHYANKFMYCLSFFPFKVVEHGNKYDPLIKGFLILPVQVFLNMLSWFQEQKHLKINCTSRAAKLNERQIRVRSYTSSNFVAQLLDGSGFEIPTHNAESEKHVNFRPDQFCCWITQQRILDQRNVFQSCNSCMLYASLRSDQCSHLSLYGLHQILCSWETSIQRHPFESLRDPMSVKMKPICSRLWIGSKLQRWARNLDWKDLRQILHEYSPMLDRKIRAHPRSAAWIFLQDRRTSWCTFLHQCLDEDELSFHLENQIFCSNRSSGAWSSSRFQLPGATIFHAWSRLQLGILVVLRDSPCRHSYR